MKIPFSRARPSTWIALFVVAAIVFFVWHSFSQNESDAPAFAHATMTVQRADGKSFPFDIEVATTTDQQAYGLMFRHALPSDAGMLFLWPANQIVIMWMKNTFIPLDMLFVKENGTIAKIITNAEPLDLTPLSSDGMVRAVVEINAGEAERRGLKPGDKVLFPGLSGTP